MPLFSSPSPPAPASAASIVSVDDDPLVAELLGNLLQQAGFQGPLRSISNPATASDFFRAARGPAAANISLIFLDLNLPSSHGFELLRTVRENPALKRAFVVVLSGSPEKDDKDGAFSLGADAFMVKFPDTTELTRLRATMEQRQSSQNSAPPIPPPTGKN